MKNVCTPHCHPQSLDSASTPEAFAKKEVELGTGTLTCSDHGSLGAIYKCYELAKKNNLTLIPSLEFYMRDDNCPIVSKFGITKTNTVPKGSEKGQWALDHPDGTFIDYRKYFHGTLGFRDFKAYKTGVKLLSKADARAEQHGSERKPLFSWSDIEELAAQNTTLGSGCLVGLVANHLLTTQPQDVKIGLAKAYFEHLLYLFKDRFYVEVMPHQCTHNYVKGVFIETNKETFKFHFDKKLRTTKRECSAEELADTFDKEEKLIAICNYRVWTDCEAPLEILKVEKKEGFVQNECAPWSPGGDLQFGANVFMMGMAKKYNVPILISDDSHFVEERLKIVQDVRLAQSGGWRFYSSYHRKTSLEAFTHFNKLHGIGEKQFEGWIDNNSNFAESFKNFEFESKPQLPTKFFPTDTLKHTQELIKKHGRMKMEPRYIERLKKEIDILHRNGTIDLLPYFFVDEQICRVYRDQGQLTAAGRGSACGLLLSYLLSITHVDPIEHELSLDRFITKARIESGGLPDLDQDLPSRDLLVGYDTDVIEFMASDGTKHIMPEDFKIETDQGVLTIKDALDKKANFKEWWVSASS
jgi:DNA polymerase III alpha subunit